MPNQGPTGSIASKAVCPKLPFVCVICALLQGDSSPGCKKWHRQDITGILAVHDLSGRYKMITVRTDPHVELVDTLM
ncbi:hypothetical protein N7494_001988 [Penicillium frequentans]|uniref:Uncharacterized protein n=1 Tax=Penicillium frequentans TaxID=3151616 RepID=A0AAD6GK22_9EURO|nr:hypothetical protein N7494_001988 [Penicillium glabrum]